MKKILLLIIICLSLILVSCKKPEKVVKIVDVSFTETYGIFEYSINDFLLENIKIKIEYGDNTKKEVSLTKDMISVTDFEKLLTSGTHEVEVICEEKSLTAFITIKSTKYGQDNLPLVVLYDITTENQGKYENIYYTTGAAEFVSFQLQYQFDVNDVKDVQLVKAEGLVGSFISKVEDGIITITYSQFEPYNGKTEIFRIIFNSDQKNNNFVLDTNFDNAFFAFDQDVSKIKIVGYFTR